MHMRQDVIDGFVERCIPPKAYVEQWDLDLLHEEILRIVGLDLHIKDWAKEEGIADEEIRDRLNDAANRKMAEKAANYGPEVMRSVEKSILLQLLDQIWKEHLLTLFDEKTSIYEQNGQYGEYVKKPDFLLSEPHVQLNNARHRGQPCNRFQQR